MDGARKDRIVKAKNYSKLIEKGYTIVSGGTDNHTVLWNLRPQGITGSKIEKICEK